MRRLSLLVLGLALLSVGRAAPPRPSSPAAPPEPPPPPRARQAAPDADRPTEKWTVDDVVLTEHASDVRVSPDGRFVVWVKTVMDKDKGERVSQLVRSDLSDGRDVELTRGPDSCVRPRWSPDGKLLAFLSSRPVPKTKPDKKGGDDDEPKTQLWLLDPIGGEPWALTDVARGILTYDWAGPDALVYAAQEDAGYRETRLKDERKDDTVVVEDEKTEPPARLFRVAVKTKKATRLTDNADRIESLAVSPDGRWAVAQHSRSLRYTYDNRVKPVLFLYDLSTGARKPVFADPKYNVSSVVWAPDGTGFYALDDHNSQPEFSQAGVPEPSFFDLAAGKETKIDLGWERGLSWQPDNYETPALVPLRDGFLALLADGVRPRAARYRRDGAAWKRDWLAGEHAARVTGIASGPNGGTLVYAHSTATKPVQWYRAPLDGQVLGAPTPLFTLNEHLKKKAVARVEVVRWKGGLDEEVEGLLSYPHDYQEGKKYPLVVMIHGGPAAADLDAWEERWSYAPNLICQRGAFVLRPNYHGSAAYGLAWLESITRGKYLEPELADIESGVDALIARGLVDPGRLGLYGWSNGAILTNLLTTKTTRYKAAVTGAGNVEYVSDWATCEFGDAFDRYYLGKTPLEDPQLYIKKSPFFHLDKVRTPTLILFGTEDRIVHTSQGWVQFRALQQLAKTEVRFVLFPGEKHGFKKLAHQRRKLEEELAWFDRHLFGTAKDEGVVKPDSPLATALKRRQAKRDGGRFGVVEDGKLIPETVKLGGLTVGRFEVTRAQFREFDPNYAVEPGTENYPANNVSYERAQAYCAWLSRHTGRAYRLPEETEAEELYERGEAGEGENTLDRWAGYTVNPEDAARLREAAKELDGAAPLLREVGAGRGVADPDGEAVFDLGGNVAEWTAGKDGKGKLRGGSADQPLDAKATTQAAPEYRGFRVILDTPGK
jgi:dipeptidyl aminopeptidase/acylaminoacyl peptidase